MPLHLRVVGKAADAANVYIAAGLVLFFGAATDEHAALARVGFRYAGLAAILRAFVFAALAKREGADERQEGDDLFQG
ncbi:MAG: hypothetical protein ACK5XL_14475 [Cyclobacteriaceae bacterium]